MGTCKSKNLQPTPTTESVSYGYFAKTCSMNENKPRKSILFTFVMYLDLENCKVFFNYFHLSDSYLEIVSFVTKYSVVLTVNESNVAMVNKKAINVISALKKEFIEVVDWTNKLTRREAKKLI